MRFRDPTLAYRLAPTFLNVLLLLKQEGSAVEEYCLDTLAYLCRKLELFVIPRVSAEAKAKADALKIGDLSKFAWADQPKKKAMGDHGREIFHFEHVMPASMMVNDLLSLPEPNVEDVAAIIAKADIAWITKTEDKKLTAAGFRSNRSNPIECYSSLGIIFVSDHPAGAGARYGR